MLTISMVVAVWNLLPIRHGLTHGRQLVVPRSLIYVAVAAGLTGATIVAIRRGDRDPAWRYAAWLFAVLTGLVAVAGYTM